MLSYRSWLVLVMEVVKFSKMTFCKTTLYNITKVNHLYSSMPSMISWHGAYGGDKFTLAFTFILLWRLKLEEWSGQGMQHLWGETRITCKFLVRKPLR
jgi:hypothetical protein